ncbi:amino acid adenylation domain-containing protein [Lysobacter enzymogenes]|uniref:amino acid adenylation domain-containing protein n=1 Tax=Lysobacter enzymogenes TaxID=69 RepID=UPI0033925C73
MNVVEGIIERALQAQVALYLKDGKLAYTAAGDGLSDALRAEIGAHKTQIIEYLNGLSAHAGDRDGGWTLERAPRDGARPLSSQQRQIWLAQNINEQGQYNIANAFEFRGPLDRALLARTLAYVLERHEILRTVYVADAAGEVSQRVLDASAFALDGADLSALDADAQRADLAARVAAEQARPFDLGRDFPIRAACYYCSPTRAVVSIVIHHIASDGWSQELLVQEIGAVYQALSQGRAPALAPLPLQYGDYAYSQHKALAEGRFERERGYWLEQLADVPAEPTLPTDFARPKVFVSSGAALESRLDAEQTGRLSALAKRHNLTLFMLLESTLALLIARWSGREDVVVGSPIAGRELAQTHGMIGLFVNLLPLRARCPARGSLEQYLLDSKARLLQAFAMQSLPLGVAMEALGVEQTMGHTPLFQAVFNLQTVADGSLGLGEIELAPLPQAPLIKYDLEVVALQGADGLSLSWKYADRLFAAATIEKLAQAYRAVLIQIGAGEAADLADLAFGDLGARAGDAGAAAADERERACAIVQAHFPEARIAWVRQGGATAPRNVVHLLPASLLAGGELSQRQAAAAAQQLQDELGAAWCPDAWSLVGEDCLSASGKLDKKKLPAIAFALETPIQREVAAVWREMLECGEIGLTDDFFDLGGNSIKAMRATSKLSQVCSVEMQIRDIFEHTVLADYAAQVEARASSTRPAIGKRPHGERMALSFSQERLWFIDQLNGGSPEYNMPALFQLEGRFDLDLAERALRRVLERHEVLRTVYAGDEAGAAQRVLEQFDFRVERVDLRALGEAQAREELSRRVHADIARPFDLATELMVRASWFSLAASDRGAERGVLLFNVHHIACDGWSQDLLVNEFVVAYRQLDGEGGNGAPPPELPALSIQYGDYAHWQRQWLGSGQFDRQLDYWLRQLEDVPATHQLRLDRPRPQVKAYLGDSLIGGVDQATTQALDALAKRFQLTPFMLTHAALALVLARNGNSDDIVVGTPVANRHQAQTEHLIGFFINTLVLRLRTGHANLADYLREVRQVHLDAQTHQDVPFELLVDRLNIPRSAQHTPLFQIMLTSDADYGLKRGDERALLELPGARIRTYPFEGFAAKFDLEINISQTGDGTAIRWTYDRGIFERASVERLNDHLQRLLGALAALAADAEGAQQAPLARLPMLSQAETRLLLERGDGARVDYPRERCLHELFEAQAARTPDALALECDGAGLSYRQLHARADAIARHLRAAHGVGRGRLVGVCLERTPEMVAAVLGILKAGGAYVPLDPAYPPARTAHILEDAAIDLVLTQRSLHAGFDGQRCVAVEVEAIAEPADGDAFDPARSSASDLAYLIYTSGSTGKPKGVAIGHSNAVSMLYWAKATYRDEELARVLASTSLNFDLSVFELFLPLCFGHTCVLVRDALALIERPVRATLINTVPSAIKVLLESGAVPPGTLTVNLAGEPLPAPVINALLGSGVCGSVYNLYGPSEDTTYSTWARFDAPIDGPVPIGRVLANSQGLVLSPALALLPPGVAGELYLCGAGVAQGYYNNPALTAERFIDNPYYDADNPDSGPVLYRTGDLVRYDERGMLHFLGRGDSQVKLHGFRIELGEIEQQLARQPGVKSAIALVRGPGDGNRQLVAYVEPAQMPAAPEQAGFVAALREALAQALPGYMLPAAIALIERWPLSPNGKIDRAALPAADGSAERQVHAYREPDTALERRLLAIWRDLLARDRIGADDDFFALGGNSLLLTRLHSRIKSECGVAVPVKTLFAQRSIAAHAYIIESFQTVVQAQDALAEDAVEEEI